MKTLKIINHVCVGYIRRVYGLDNVIEIIYDDGSLSYMLLSEKFSYGRHLESCPKLDIMIINGEIIHGKRL